MNPAFDYLRQFKKVSDEAEELVMKVIKKRYPEISLNELVNIFELRNSQISEQNFFLFRQIIISIEIS